MPISEKTAALLKALETCGYDAKPSKLRQGCISAIPPDGLTEEQEEMWWDKLYESVRVETNAFGQE